MRNTGQGSFLQSLEQATSNGTALAPMSYNAIDKSLKETEQYRSEVERQLKHPEIYLKLRKFVKEKFLGKRVKSIDELFDLQLDAMRRINYGLDVINNEARQRLNTLEKYIERVHYEYENNFLGIDDKKDSLFPLLKEYIILHKEFSTLTKNNKDYFDAERKLRLLKRELSEGSLRYKKMLDLVDDLDREKGSLNALEDFFRYSIQLSERMVEKAMRFEDHVANTKDAYIMARNINLGFAAVLKAVQSSSSMISQLQSVLAEGLAGMGDAVSNPDLPPYKEFEVMLKSRCDAVKGLVNRNDQNKEKKVDMEKKGLIR